MMDSDEDKFAFLKFEIINGTLTILPFYVEKNNLL